MKPFSQFNVGITSKNQILEEGIKLEFSYLNLNEYLLELHKKDIHDLNILLLISLETSHYEGEYFKRIIRDIKKLSDNLVYQFDILNENGIPTGKKTEKIKFKVNKIQIDNGDVLNRHRWMYRFCEKYMLENNLTDEDQIPQDIKQEIEERAYEAGKQQGKDWFKNHAIPALNEILSENRLPPEGDRQSECISTKLSQRESENNFNLQVNICKDGKTRERKYTKEASSNSKKLRNKETTTEAEKLMWYYLKDRKICDLKFRRQSAIGNYVVDFVCVEKKLIIELDGGQHNNDKDIVYDEERTKYLNSLGYIVIRFWNNEIFKNMNGVLQTIYDNLSNRLPPEGDRQSECISTQLSQRESESENNSNKTNNSNTKVNTPSSSDFVKDSSSLVSLKRETIIAPIPENFQLTDGITKIFGGNDSIPPIEYICYEYWLKHPDYKKVEKLFNEVRNLKDSGVEKAFDDTAIEFVKRLTDKNQIQWFPNIFVKYSVIYLVDEMIKHTLIQGEADNNFEFYSGTLPRDLLFRINEAGKNGDVNYYLKDGLSNIKKRGFVTLKFKH